MPVDRTPPPPDDLLSSQPQAFVADTDSKEFCLDSAANRVIVNDPKLLCDFQTVSSPGVKGIGGTPVKVLGVGTLHLSLQSDSGQVDKFRLPPAVYVPTSPYNLVPPQILFTAMREQGYNPQRFSHDDTDYVLRYRHNQQK